MNRDNFIHNEQNELNLKNKLVCDSYGQCFDCWYKNSCIYKREKDLENIFGQFSRTR
jgi:hypothetical protein